MPSPTGVSNDNIHSRAVRPGLMTWASELAKGHSALIGLKLPAEAIPSDASNRLLFRAQTDKGTVILIDAPSQTENNQQFAALSGWYLNQGINVPKIHAMDLDAGYFVVSDLGRQTYLEVLEATPALADQLYREAIEVLLKLARLKNGTGIPEYSQERFRNELGIFRQWCVEAWLGLDPPDFWDDFCQQLLAVIAEQPKVCVHRDFHSRNLIARPNGVGLVDYQDTLMGPLSYDIGSLLWDCYIDWPQDYVLVWLDFFRKQSQRTFDLEIETEQFIRWATLTVSQRHLKAIGIFVRLYLQVQRPAYLAYIPRVLTYLKRHLGVLDRDHRDWFEACLYPAIETKLKELDR